MDIVMNKKILGALTALIMATTAGGVVSASDFDFTIDENGKADIAAKTHLIENSRVSICILNPYVSIDEIDAVNESTAMTDKFAVVAQALSDGNGDISYSYSLSDDAKSGEYVCRLKVYGESEEKLAAAKYMNQSRHDKGIELLRSEQNKEAVLEEYADDIDLSLGAVYRAMNEDEKNYTMEEIKTNSDSYNGFTASVNNIVTFRNIKDKQNTDAKNIFENNASALGVTQDTVQEYNQLSATSKDLVFVRLQNNIQSAYTPDVLEAQLIQAMNSIQTGGSSSGGSSYGGGGSSGGGGGSSVSIFKGATDENTLLPVPSDELFEDLPVSHWAYPAVMKLVEKNVVNGVDDKHFAPDKYLTREELVQLVIRAFEYYEDYSGENKFEDVPEEAWYYPAVMKGVGAGIIKGMDETHFGSGQSVTRQDMAVIIMRAVDADETAEIYVVDENKSIADIDAVSDYAKDAVERMVKGEIINGKEDGNFDPFGKATRAEAAQIIYKILYK